MRTSVVQAVHRTCEMEGAIYAPSTFLLDALYSRFRDLMNHSMSKPLLCSYALRKSESPVSVRDSSVRVVPRQHDVLVLEKN